MRISIPHFEPVIACDGELAWFHPQHSGSRRSDLTPGPKFRQGEWRPFGLHLDTAIALVANPSADAEIQGAPTAAGPEPHLLDAALNHPAPAFDETLDPLGLLAADKPVGDRFSPASSAARHREQIVVELAQCRCTQLA